MRDPFGAGDAGRPPPPTGADAAAPRPGWDPSSAPGTVAGPPGGDPPPEPTRVTSGWSPPPPGSWVPPAPRLQGPWPAPAPAPAGAGWAPPAPGPLAARRTVVRHRPGLGLGLAIVGLVLLALSLTSLPWVSVGGEDISLSDIRKAFDGPDKRGDVPTPPTATVPPDLTIPPVTDAGGNPIGVPVTPPPLGPVVSPPGTAPPLGPVMSPPGTAPPLGPVVSPPAGMPPDTSVPAVPAAPAASDGGESHFIKTYAQGVWVLVLGWAGVAVLFATLVVPGSTGARGLLGFLMAGPLGLAVGLVDDEGTVGLRVCGALATLACAGIHFAAVQDFFPDHGGPSWGYGLWASLGAFVVILVGCAVGTQQERFPAPP